MIMSIMLFRHCKTLLLICLAAMLTALTLTAAPSDASAATGGQPTTARVVYGDRMLTVAWLKVAGATGYRVQYGVNKTFKGATSLVIKNTTTATLKNLINKRRYYVRVLALQGATAPASNTVIATPLAGYPEVMPKVTVTPGANQNEIKVSWGRLQRATRVMVLAGSDNQQAGSYFHSDWLPATATSITLTIPPRYRWLIGSGTGNAIYAKLGQYNDVRATQIRKTRSDSAHYRLSLANAYGFATPLAVRGDARLKVATYNIQSVAASEPGHPWGERRDRVINNIMYSDSDLIGLQEDDAAKSMDYQHRQVARALAPHGYTMSGDLPGNYAYANDVTDSWMYYRASVLTRLDGGIISPREDLHMNWPRNITDRRGTWAKFKVNATGAVFYALNMHLPSGKGQQMVDLRVREAAALNDLIRVTAGNTPVIFIGDFNAAALRDGYCATSKLRELGWYDTASTLNRTNHDLQTANAPVPYPHGKPERALNVNTGRIDYILTLNMGGSIAYQNQNVLNVDGTPNLAYQGSDHNLQSATLAF